MQLKSSIILERSSGRFTHEDSNRQCPCSGGSVSPLQVTGCIPAVLCCAVFRAEGAQNRYLESPTRGLLGSISILYTACLPLIFCMSRCGLSLTQQSSMCY